MQFKDDDKSRLKRERAEYRARKNKDDPMRQIQELQAQLRDQSTRLDQMTAVTDTSSIGGQQSHISQLTTGTMMGGRNEQAKLRNRGSS